MRTKLTLIIPLIVTLSLLFIPFNLIYAQDETPEVTVEDQTIGEDNMVTVSEVISPTQGWIVIHQEVDDSPGPVIGQAMVESGTNTNVMVEIDPAMVTDTLFAMLHEDTGVTGEYEFPDADPPVTDEEGNVVMGIFSVAVEEPVEEPAAEEPAAEEPADLPETGFDFLSFYLIAGILLIIGALGILYLRKPKEE
ncbi:MAG: LPXTG cell wall anchor domain-containing protein [Actinomycetota bacterium]